jgi:preprotein translocase subunit SecA
MFPFDFLTRVFGSNNERILKKYRRIVKEINKKEEEYVAFSDEALKNCTFAFKERVKSGTTLDELLPDAFAVLREASKRVLGMRPFDVQLIGAISLHNGMISEMKTGEGKTLVATLAVYLNALTEKGVHVITVNDYLAKRDSGEMSRLYGFLGLTTGCIVHGLSDRQRKENYACDITYGTNHEFGFDYLRDNMKFRLSEMVQRTFNYAVVDEVDSILIDEARTPLIISGPSEDSSDMYRLANQVIERLQEGDWEKDEKQKTVTLTDQGIERIENILGEMNAIKGNNLYDIHNIALVHHTMAALKAHKIFTKDVDYIVKDEKVVIIDEFTGRMMDGRRYSEGLHQAIEAKEYVDIENENQTLASITYQNFFRLYPKLSGMTGTALTEAAEFEEIYNLQVLTIPTNVSVQRKDYDDEVYLTNREKYPSVVKVIRECHAKGQPVLVGTASIERSEILHDLLKKEKIPHAVLNARYHEQEAAIIAEAGRPGAVTIATNMAGRGTDIKLGGSLEMHIRQKLNDVEPGLEYDQKLEKIKQDIDEAKKRVLASGGLYIVGTERHESRRIDNQLRGRAGRQGDPGASKFFVSLEDDLMRRFGSDRLDAMLRKFGAKEGEVISHPWVNKALARAQAKVEAYNFEMRKHLLKYDDVVNDQRKIIYEQRLHVISSEDVSSIVQDMRENVIENVVWSHMPEDSLPDQWDINGLHAACREFFNLDLPIDKWINEEFLSQRAFMSRLTDHLDELMREKEERYGSEIMRTGEKNALLRTLDQHWKDHLLSLDHLRQGINLRSYAQNNPLNEYKREAFNLFQQMMKDIKSTIVSQMSHFDTYIPTKEDIEETFNPDFDLSKFFESTPNWEDEPLFEMEEALADQLPHAKLPLERHGSAEFRVSFPVFFTPKVSFKTEGLESSLGQTSQKPKAKAKPKKKEEKIQVVTKTPSVKAKSKKTQETPDTAKKTKTPVVKEPEKAKKATKPKAKTVLETPAKKEIKEPKKATVRKKAEKEIMPEKPKEKTKKGLEEPKKTTKTTTAKKQPSEKEVAKPKKTTPKEKITTKAKPVKNTQEKAPAKKTVKKPKEAK